VLSACVENLTGGLEELKEHFQAHYLELANYRDKIPLDPIYPVYLERDAAGQVLYVALRDDGKLIGYFVGFVSPQIHYKSCLTLTQDIFFINPTYRNGSPKGALMLFRAVEAEARRRGVHKLYYGCKTHRETSALFERLGMEETERMFSKWIGD